MAITAAITLNGTTSATIPSGGRCAVQLTVTNGEAADAQVLNIGQHIANGDGMVFGDPFAGRSPILGRFVVPAGGTLVFEYDVTVRDSRAKDSTPPTRTVGATVYTDNASYAIIAATSRTLTIDDTP